jgi:ABC-type uncharacterized transport system substrate-binding protein
MMRFLFGTCVLLAFGAHAGAHPHVWIEARAVARFDAQGLAGFTVEWRFDELFSGGILADFDADRDRRLSSTESEAIRRGAFANLGGYHYFIYLRDPGGRRSGVRQTEAFQASLDGQGRVLYRFFVPWRVAYASGPQSVGIAIYDESYFVDIRFAQVEALRTEGQPQPESSVQFVEDPASAYWGGTIVPKEIRFRFGSRP